MPHIHHVALWVADIGKVCDFYSSVFGAEVGPLYENPAKGFASRFVAFGEGAQIEVMTSTQLALPAHEPGAQRMGLAHVAISLGSERAVDEMAARLRASGVAILDGPRRTGDGYYECVILDPEGNRVEVTA